MTRITYTILPPRPNCLFPVVRFELREPEWPDPAIYEVATDATGLCWKPGHRVLENEISPAQAREAWAAAMEYNDLLAF